MERRIKIWNIRQMGLGPIVLSELDDPAFGKTAVEAAVWIAKRMGVEKVMRQEVLVHDPAGAYYARLVSEVIDLAVEVTRVRPVVKHFLVFDEDRMPSADQQGTIMTLPQLEEDFRGTEEEHTLLPQLLGATAGQSITYRPRTSCTSWFICLGEWV